MTSQPAEQLDTLLERITQLDGGWRKAVFSRPHATERWEKLVAEPVALPGGPAVKLVRTAAGRESAETVPEAAWAGVLNEIGTAAPSHLNILARDCDWHARLGKRGRWLVTRARPSLPPAGGPVALAPHDRERSHALPADDPAVRQLFIETGIFGLNGRLRGEAAAKYRQVQHFLELLRPLDAWEDASGSEVRILDAGCGRAYLSLALYALGERLGRPVRLIGVDRSEEALAPVRKSAARLGYARTAFHARSIEDFAAAESGNIDLLVSLHACDTATDEALAAGVRLSARAIVLVPCCHHELVAQIEERERAGETPPEWHAALASGLLTHRLADIVTDALRASALESLGYRVSVIEFVSPEATARNLMLRAERRPAGAATDDAMQRGREAYRALASTWHVQPALERLLGELWKS